MQGENTTKGDLYYSVRCRINIMGWVISCDAVRVLFCCLLKRLPIPPGAVNLVLSYVMQFQLHPAVSSNR